MKKIITLSLVATVASATMAFAPTSDNMSFQGIVKYSVIVDNATNPKMADMMKNSTFEIYLAPGKSKSIMTMPMGTQSSINGLFPDSAVALTDFGGQKTAMKVPLNGTAAARKAPDIQYLNDTKQIAGYTCHKAEIKSTDGSTTDLYYTDQLPSYQGKSGEYKGLKGFPLEFSTNNRGMTITFSAISVTKQTLPGSTFAIPDGYTMRAMQSGMQPGMQQHTGGQPGMGGH